MGKRKFRFFAGDFETTVFKGQEYTEVWGSAIVEFYTEDVVIFNSIEKQFKYINGLKGNLMIYYHNLKFDGSFWLSFLINTLGLKQAIVFENEEKTKGYFLKEKEMPNNSFKYSITDTGQWYKIVIKTKNRIIELRDSLKLLPFSLSEIAESFKTKHKKLNLEYKGFRFSGCEIKENEKEYIANDVLVLKEALEIMFSQGHNKLTIGSCCLSEFKETVRKKSVGYNDELYNNFFPNLLEYKIDSELYGSENADYYIRKSYKGGWCYVVKGKENIVFKNGLTVDVNSLYPSMMSSESGNYYPIGLPLFWKGNYIPDEVFKKKKYFFIRIRTRFYLKNGKLPFLQIKGNPFYKGNENLTSSDILDKKTNEYITHYSDKGKMVSTAQTITMTMTDYKLFIEHYDVKEFEILDGCYFNAVTGLFDEYIEKYKRIKMNSAGAIRQIAKLFLNNLYGKMASNDNSSFKVSYIDEKGVLRFYTITEHNKKVGFIPVGSAITSYARNFTIRTAQKNFYGVNRRGFIYADTDSIHCDLNISELKGVELHETKFNHWSVESKWSEGVFVRQKTYIEVVNHNGKTDVEPQPIITCAGMPERSKKLFLLSLKGEPPDGNFSGEEIEFIKKKRELTDFKVGLSIPGNLRAKQIKGGVILVDESYVIRDN